MNFEKGERVGVLQKFGLEVVRVELLDLVPRGVVEHHYGAGSFLRDYA